MSRLLLLRHGQASFHADDYDQLSERGHAQARQLGAWLAAAEPRIDAVYVGTKKRQRQTEQGIAAAFAAVGRAWPAARTLPALDEVRFELVVRTIVKERHSHDEELQTLGRRYLEEQDREAKPRAFHRLAQAVCKRWLAEERPIPETELWPDLRRRVVAGFRHIRAEQGRGKVVAVVTSAGPISALLQESLGCGDHQAVGLWWKLANTAVTELLFTEELLTMKSFNSLPHLPAPGDWTYL